MAKIRVRVSGHQKLGQLARRARAAADGGLQRDLQAELARVAPPVLDKTRAAVLGASFPDANPTGGGRGTGLRGRLAAATTTKPLSTGVRFTVEGDVVSPESPRSGHRLAQLTDTELAHRWRHPTFAKSPWRTQLGMPWFFVSIRAEIPRFESGVERVIEKTAKKIEG